jgi:subfamily B ATP-binding cassette protein MsbA
MKLYLRILKYLRPYWLSLVGSLISIILFAFFNTAFLVAVMPFLKTVFQPPAEQQTLSEPLVKAPPPALTQSPVPSFLEKEQQKLKDKVYRLFLGDDPRKALERICLLIVVLFFLKSIFDYLQAYLMAQVEQSIIRDLRDELYVHINALSLDFFHQTRTGQIISRITNDVNLINGGVSASFVTLVKNPLMIIASLSVAFYLSWQLTLVALVVAPASMVLIGWIGLKLRKQSVISQEKMADVTAVLQETIAGVRVVKAFAMEKFEIKKFMAETQRYYQALLRITRTRNLASPVTEFLSAAVGVGILWFGGRQVLQGHLLAPEEFIGFLAIFFSIMQPVKELASVNNRIQEALAASERIFKVIDLQPAIRNVANPKQIAGFNSGLEFCSVSFSYNRKDVVLKDVSVHIRKGEILAIVGPSGAGKSTFVDLIPRFYDPQQGAIRIDDLDIREIDLSNLRHLMGVVTQETILFNESVRNNIAYGLEDKSLDDVIAAAKIANAHEFIMQLAHGYETNIGERGVTLSGGQRQRLAIARAVLKNPPILILDEATSALDTESELLVQQAIERLMKNRTSFVIAHRLSTILNADRIIVLDQGRIVQQGTHENLVNQPGLYQKLYNMQFRL